MSPRINIKNTNLIHIVAELLKTKDKEKIKIKTSRGKKDALKKAKD